MIPKDTSCKTPRWRMLKSQLNNLSAKDFSKAIQNTKDAVVIDVRTAAEFQSIHIPNAINLDYFADDFYDRIETLNPNKNYFIYCRSGRRSIRVCTLMRNGGFDSEKIYNLDQGYTDWLTYFPK